MDTLTVRPCRVAEIEEAPGIDALLAEYAQECALEGLPPPAPHFETYRRLEQSGVFFVFGAFIGDSLVGFLTLAIPILPHYSARIAVAESFFVGAHDRRSGAGHALRRAAEACAMEQEAYGLLISAPTGGRLERALSGLADYRQSNSVFLKVLA